MKKLTSTFALTAATLALAACGSADDASTEATADTVEMPADEALEPVTEEPVADDAATEDAGGAAVDDATATSAADAAANVAAEAEAAAAAIEGAVDAVEEVVD